MDFQLYPLSFFEYLTLIHLAESVSNKQAGDLAPEAWNALESAFLRYLQHGGYLSALNDFTKNQQISAATLQTYSDWIRGDILKRGKQERYLKKVLAAILKHQGSQITWHTLAKELSIDHHKMVADYVTLLENMSAVHIQFALLEDKLVAAPKKARKLFFTDPFVYHAINHWLQPMVQPYQQILQHVNDPQISSQLVEAVVLQHFKRHFETYYLKAEGEVDIAYIAQQKFWPIELKWRGQLRAADLKQIRKYPQGRLWIKTRETGMLEGVAVEPLILALAKLG